MKHIFRVAKAWLLSDSAVYEKVDNTKDYEIDWLRVIPFIMMHLVCLFVFAVGVSWIAVTVAFVLYCIRIFAIGAFYHRYFSHATYKANRFWQFIFAILGASATQRGPLWWAAHHRDHHTKSDQPHDPHSPVQHGFFWSHVGWFLSRRHYYFNASRIKDLMRFAELRLLDRLDTLVPVLLAVGTYYLGAYLEHAYPSLHTNGWQMLIWGFFISTVFLLHVTVSINSVMHRFGVKRFPTKDNSRNNWLFAILTFGEGWHNNHHYYATSTRQGFVWYEFDLTYYILKLMQKLHIIHDMRGVPKDVMALRNTAESVE